MLCSAARKKAECLPRILTFVVDVRTFVPPQAPAVDVLAFGLADGRIVVHNVKVDEALMTLRQESGALGSPTPVTAISFRTDGKAPHMVSGSPEGHIAVWNLEERKLEAEVRHAHDGPVAGLEFQQGEPLLVSNSPDNSIKVSTVLDFPNYG